MIRYDKISSYLVTLRPMSGDYFLKIKLNMEDEAIEIKISTAAELAAITELLRNEKNTFFDRNKDEIVIGWEPAGENDPKYDKYSR